MTWFFKPTAFVPCACTAARYTGETEPRGRRQRKHRTSPNAESGHQEQAAETLHDPLMTRTTTPPSPLTTAILSASRSWYRVSVSFRRDGRFSHSCTRRQHARRRHTQHRLRARDPTRTTEATERNNGTNKPADCARWNRRAESPSE
jgi:hypothetical protein